MKEKVREEMMALVAQSRNKKVNWRDARERNKPANKSGVTLSVPRIVTC